MMARFEDPASRWRSWGGLVVAIACGNAIAALNWFAVLRLVIGLRLVDGRSATGHPASA